MTAISKIYARKAEVEREINDLKKIINYLPVNRTIADKNLSVSIEIQMLEAELSGLNLGIKAINENNRNMIQDEIYFLETTEPEWCRELFIKRLNGLKSQLNKEQKS